MLFDALLKQQYAKSTRERHESESDCYPGGTCQPIIERQMFRIRSVNIFSEVACYHCDTFTRTRFKRVQ